MFLKIFEFIWWPLHYKIFFMSGMRGDFNNFKSSVYTLDMGIVLPTTLGLIVSAIIRSNSLFVFFVIRLQP